MVRIHDEILDLRKDIRLLLHELLTSCISSAVPTPGSSSSPSSSDSSSSPSEPPPPEPHHSTPSQPHSLLPGLPPEGQSVAQTLGNISQGICNIGPEPEETKMRGIAKENYRNTIPWDYSTRITAIRHIPRKGRRPTPQSALHGFQLNRSRADPLPAQNDGDPKVRAQEVSRTVTGISPALGTESRMTNSTNACEEHPTTQRKKNKRKFGGVGRFLTPLWS